MSVCIYHVGNERPVHQPPLEEYEERNFDTIIVLLLNVVLYCKP